MSTHLRCGVLAIACALAPLAARAQAAPLPFSGATQAYAVSGCGTGVRPTLCANGTALVGTAVSSFGIPVYQVLLDLALERQAGFQTPFLFDGGYLTSSYLRQVDGAPRTDILSLDVRYSLSDTRFTAWPLLGALADYVAPGSVQLMDGRINFFYRDPSVSSGEFAYTGISLSMSAVPEPSTIALVAAGGLTLVAVARRRAAQIRA